MIGVCIVSVFRFSRFLSMVNAEKLVLWNDFFTVEVGFGGREKLPTLYICFGGYFKWDLGRELKSLPTFGGAHLT